MRFLAIVAALAACSSEPRGREITAATRTTATLDVTFVDTIDGARATHLAVGGRMRVRVPGALAWSARGPFVIAQQSDDTFAVMARGAGDGEIEIDTIDGLARFQVSAAHVASATVLPDGNRATVALRDGLGNRLVDASLRVAPGSVPVTFARDAWDRIELTALPGDVLVKTDFVGATRATRVGPAEALHGAGAPCKSTGDGRLARR